MTENKQQDTGESGETNRATLKRRDVIGVLAATGGLAAVGASQSGASGGTGIGGGPMSSDAAHLQVELIQGEFSERPSAGVENRVFRVDDPGDSRHGTVYKDDGESWNLIELGVRSLNADEARIGEQYFKSEQINPLPGLPETRLGKDRRGYYAFAGELIDDFEDLSNWTATTGSISATSDSYMGSQALQIDVTDGDGEALAEAERSFSSLDLSGKNLAIAMKDETSRGVAGLLIYLEDGPGREIRVEAEARENNPWLMNDCFLTSLGSRLDLDTFDFSDVQNITIRHWPGTGSHPPLKVDNLRAVKRPETPKVIFTFDDGFATDYTKAKPYLDNYGYGATSFVVPPIVGDSERMTWNQIQELSENGWTIGNHTYRNDPIGSGSITIEEEIRWGKELTQARVNDHSADALSYNSSVHKGSIVDEAAKYSQLGYRQNDRGVIGPYPTNPLLMWRLSGDPTVSDAKQIIDDAVTFGGFCPLLFHQIDPSSGNPGTSESDFQEVVDYVASYEQSRDLDVIGTDDVVSELGYYHFA